jgi:hypothetical protein
MIRVHSKLILLLVHCLGTKREVPPPRRQTGKAEKREQYRKELALHLISPQHLTSPRSPSPPHPILPESPSPARSPAPTPPGSSLHGVVTADTALMDPKSPDDRPQAAAPQPQPLEWRFAQVFGERGAGEDVQEGNPPARMPRTSAPRLAPREIYSVSWCGFDAAAPRAFRRGMRGSPRFGQRRPLRIDRMIVSRLLPRLRLVPGTVPSILLTSCLSAIWYGSWLNVEQGHAWGSVHAVGFAD